MHIFLLTCSHESVDSLQQVWTHPFPGERGRGNTHPGERGRGNTHGILKVYTSFCQFSRVTGSFHLLLAVSVNSFFFSSQILPAVSMGLLAV